MSYELLNCIATNLVAAIPTAVVLYGRTRSSSAVWTNRDGSVKLWVGKVGWSGLV